MIIDIHGHYTTAPKALEEWRNRQIAGIKDPAARPKASELKLSEIGLLWYVSEEYAAKGTATKNVVWFDDVVVATEYVGPRVPTSPR